MPFDGIPAVPRGVIILSAEDGYRTPSAPASTPHKATRPGWSSSSQVGRRRAPTTRPPAIPDDLPVLEAIIAAEDAVLVIVDPLMAFLSSETELVSRPGRPPRPPPCQGRGRTYRRVHCRRPSPDQRRTVGAHAQYAGGGSVGIIGAARLGLYVGTHPTDPALRVLAVSKSNVGRIPPSLAYSLESADPLGVAHIAWHGESNLTADECTPHAVRRSAIT